MPPIRTIFAAMSAIALLAMTPLTATALPASSGEVAGNSAAARTAVDALRAGWLADVVAGGHTASAPMVLTAAAGSNVNGVIGTTAVGTTVSVQRDRYSAHPTAPTLVGPSPTPGTAACTNTGLSMQGNSPRPASLVGNAGCTNGNGTVYTESGGAGESTTRDAVTFSFSRPVWGFGAWFGDLETRTDGLGVPAIVRVLDDTGAVLEEFQVVPTGIDQNTCSNSGQRCGNETSRWIGFTGVLSSAMVVIVGDEDATGTALDEGMGFVGPNPVDAVPELALAIDTSALGPVVAGTTVDVPVTVTNTGDVPVSNLSGLDCSPTSVAPGASLVCTMAHEVTTAELAAGSFTLSAAVSGDWTGLAASAAASQPVPLVTSTGFTITLAADISEFDTVGDVITYTATITNTGNQADQPDTITIDGVTLSCQPIGPVAPQATITCTGTLITTAAADVTRTASVAWDAEAAQSTPVTISWVGVVPPDPTVTPTVPTGTPTPTPTPTVPAASATVTPTATATATQTTTVPSATATPPDDSLMPEEELASPDELAWTGFAALGTGLTGVALLGLGALFRRLGNGIPGR